KQMKQARHLRGVETRGCVLAHGDFGLQVIQEGWITNRQIEAGRVTITRIAKRGGKVWIRIFPDKPITSKPAETRMGKGKGNPEEWVAVVKPGRVMFELEGVPEDVARRAMELASHKLPVRTRFVAREGQLG
ncbi:MAG: 50S ribosomal protein L16, partial [Longimicrobiales bacterium]